MKKRYLLLFLLLTAASAYAQTTETEPNNSFVQANVIALDAIVQGTIATNGDQDFYKVTLGQPGVLRMSVENVAATLNIVLDLYDPAQNRIERQTGSIGTNRYADKAVCAAGTYYVLVSSSSSSQTSTTPYSLTVSLDVADNYECNNSFTEARLIQAGVGIKIAIGDEGDADYFKINVTKPCVLNLAAENIPSTLRIQLKAYNPSNQQIESTLSLYGQNAYMDKIVCEPGIYYFSVNSYSNSDKSPTLFDFKVTTDESDIYECNNALAEAKQIQAGVGIKIAIGDEGDVDYFKMNVSKPCILNLAVENVPSALRLYLKVYNPANQQIESTLSAYGQNAYADKLVCEPGVYYFSVNSYSNSDKSPILFDFIVTIDESDIYECNNSFVTATQIQSGVKNKIAIGDEGDIDYFKIDVTKPCVLNVAAENIPVALAIRLRVYDSANQQIGAVNNTYGENSYLDKMVCQPGVYYVAVYSFSSSNKSATLFDFTVTANESDIYECNNSFVDAKDIPVGQPIRAALNETDDVDYFKFTVATQTTLNITIPTPPTSLNPRITVYNGSQQQVGVATGSNNQTVSINNLTLAPGTYYVRVSQTNNYVNQLYTLYVSTNCLPFTVKAGNWNDPTVWLCGQVPGSNDPVVLRHVITVPGSYTAHASQVSYEGGGSLSLGTNGQLQLGN